MENQETNLDEVLTNQELKKKHWKSIKKEFIDKIPKQFKIEVEGLEDDSEYYHPKIILNETILIRTQCSLGTNYVYGYYIILKQPQVIGNYVYDAAINIYDEEIEYILNNFEKVKDKIDFAMQEVLKLQTMKNKIDIVVQNISNNCVREIADKQKIKQSIQSLEGVIEYLENQRY